VSATGLFIIGVLVTLIVAAAMALLIYAAILDGRDAAARKASGGEAPAPPRVSGGIEASNGVIHDIDRVLLPARTSKEHPR
jgi:hypothetical protein